MNTIILIKIVQIIYLTNMLSEYEIILRTRETKLSKIRLASKVLCDWTKRYS